jgi:hypothetical protein
LAFKNSGTNLPDGSFDTDSDTYANNVEITAFTFPGNRSSHPAAPVLPTTTDDNVTTPFNTTATFNVTSNDTGAPFTSVQIVQGPAHGTASVSGLNIVYTPTNGYSGSDTLTYTVSNAGGTSTPPATVSITVQQPAPVAQPDTASVPFNTATTISVTSNDTGAPFSSVQVTQNPTHGTVQVSGLNIIYTPTSGYTGSDTFNYTVSNSTSTSSPAAVNLTVAQPAPVAQPDTASVAFNTPTTISVTSNDTGAPFSSVQVTQNPTHGTAQVNGLNITYTPTSGYSGPDSFSYTVTNSTGTSSPAAVNVTVAQPVPVAQPDSASTAANTPTTINVTSNDTGAPFSSVQVTQNPAHGTAQVSGLNIIYTPTNGYSGPDSFSYTVTNSTGTSSPATVTLSVAPAPPVAQTDQVTTAFNTAVTIDPTSNDSGAPFNSLQIVQAPAHGTAQVNGLQVVYTPAAGYSGPDTIGYTVTNGGGTSNTASIAITVQAPPVPTASPDQAVTPFNTPTTINVTSNDTGAPFTSVQVVQAPSHGTAQVNGLNITYTPTNGYSGPDSFSYTVMNSSGTSSPATVTLSVLPAPPVAQADQATTAFNTAVTLNPTSNDSGAPFNSLQIVQAPAHGTAQVNGLQVVYTPAAGYSGPDTIGYTVTNGGGTSNTAAIAITVQASLPVAQADQATTAFNTARAIDVTANDTSVVPITSVQVAQGPSHGTVTVSGLTITYTPTQGYTGPDNFTYTATSSAGTSSPANVAITVQAPPAPTANPDQAVTAFNTPTTINVTSNDVSAAPITSVQIVQGPSHGTAAVNGLNITYTPAQGYSGPDSFAYTETSAGGTSNAATVSITVQPRAGFRAGAIANATHDETLKSTAQTLDNVCVTLDGTVTRSSDQSTLYAVCRGLETDATANRNIDPALGSIRNEEAFAATDSSFDIARGISGNLESRLDLLRTPHAAATVDISHFNLRAGNSAAFSMLQSRLMSALNSGLNKAVGSADHPDRAWGVWAAGDFQVARRRDGSAGGARRSNTQSVTGGFDYRFGDNFVAGMALSYSKLDSSFRTSPGDFDAKGLVYSLYGSGSVGPATIDGHVSVAQNSFDLRRTIKFTTAETTTDAVAQAHFRGRDYLAGIRGWIPFNMSNFTVALEGGGLFLWSRVDPYIESGAGAFDLSVRREHEKLIIGNLGLEGSTRFDLGNFVLTPRIEAKYHVASGRENRTITSSFVADPLDRATIVLLSNADSDEQFYSTNLGLTMSTRRVSAEIEYMSIWGLKDFKSHQVVVNLSLPF